MHAFAHENLFRREKHKACVSFAVVYATQSCPTLSVTAWTVARQAPLSMGVPRQNTGVGCHFHLQGIFLTQGLSGHLPQVSYITGRFLTTEPPGKPMCVIMVSQEVSHWLNMQADENVLVLNPRRSRTPSCRSHLKGATKLTGGQPRTKDFLATTPASPALCIWLAVHMVLSGVLSFILKFF